MLTSIENLPQHSCQTVASENDSAARYLIGRSVGGLRQHRNIVGGDSMMLVFLGIDGREVTVVIDGRFGVLVTFLGPLFEMTVFRQLLELSAGEMRIAYQQIRMIANCRKMGIRSQTIVPVRMQLMRRRSRMRPNHQEVSPLVRVAAGRKPSLIDQCGDMQWLMQVSHEM
jgi:hypothetical protein